MADDARAAAAGGLIKVKLGGSDDLDMARIEAVRAAAPDARLFCDANEGWTRDRLVDYVPDLHRLGVEMIEQPVPAADDVCLRGLDLPMRLCADESYHLAADAPGLVGKYDMVNVKLDKTGGLTGGLEAVRAARALGLDMMVGCMLGTSLAMAPAILAGQGAAFVDLDAPLLLARDRAFPVRYEGGRLFPADQRLWG
jgi:L-alanine-DL-glutamate epimerase-like enolase superfamily enzyme